MGIATALSPQIDLATEPRWMRFPDTFGEHTELTVAMTKSLLRRLSDYGRKPGRLGKDSVNTMVKHFRAEAPARRAGMPTMLTANMRYIREIILMSI